MSYAAHLALPAKAAILIAHIRITIIFLILNMILNHHDHYATLIIIIAEVSNV